MKIALTLDGTAELETTADGGVFVRTNGGRNTHFSWAPFHKVHVAAAIRQAAGRIEQVATPDEFRWNETVPRPLTPTGLEILAVLEIRRDDPTVLAELIEDVAETMILNDGPALYEGL